MPLKHDNPLAALVLLLLLQGMTVLHIITSQVQTKNCIEIVQLLVDYGADIHAKTQEVRMCATSGAS